MPYIATPQHKNPCPKGHEIYNFGRPFLGHHHYILSLSDLCLGAKKKIFKYIMHFHHMTIMAMPRCKNPCLGGHKFTIQVRPSMYNISVFSVCQICDWEQRRKNQAFLLYYIWLFLFPYPTDATVVFKEKILTDDEQWTTHADGRQRIAIGQVT